MPLEYEVEEGTGLLLMRASGRVMPEDYFEMRERWIDDTRIPRPPRILADFREIEVSRSGGDVRRVAIGTKAYREFMQGGRQAVVATQEASFGMARMYEALLGDAGYDVAVFRDPEEARRWVLGER